VGVRRAVAFFALWISACTCGVAGVSDDVYACRSSADCNDDQECTDGRCQKKGTVTGCMNDCSVASCDAMACAPHGFVCTAGACACSGNGGTPEPQETNCTDGADNDCDGATDCEDPDCKGVSCGSGCVCNAGKHEVNCADGVDNDGDGLIDCMDPDCTHKPCSTATPAAVCCGIGSSAAQCKNLSADANNCGGCGVTCRGGSCQAMSASGTTSGQCSCGGPNKCPSAPAQSCSGGYCACASAADCASGQQCSSAVCHY
jgi:hypothetical protein